MTKLAIIDLDGVIADATVRFAKAEEVKQSSKLPYKEVVDLYWRTVFTSEHVALDTLIEGADECVIALSLQGYDILYLTSRPESMRKATEQWLSQFDFFASDDHLIMKPPAFQYTKTVVWKAGTVQMLATMTYASEVLFIDDEAMNIAELQKYEHPFQLRCATSLDIAVNGESETDVEESESSNPF